MKTVTIFSLITLILVIFSPIGLEALIFFSTLMAAISFRAHPVISANTFAINIMFTTLHIPGFVFPQGDFLGQAVLIHPEVGVHWSLLVFLIIFVLAAFYAAFSRNTVKKDSNIRPSLLSTD